MLARNERSDAQPGNARLRELDLAHHLPAQQNYRLMQKLGGSRIIARAEGCYIYDADGVALLDGMAGLWCVNVGYGRAELAEVAQSQMLQLPFYNTFFRTATAPTVMLAARIAAICGGELQHVFFSNSGSEANDTAFRLVRHYWDLRGQPQRKVFISRWNAYHGSTVAGVSLGGMKLMHAQGDLPIPGVEHVMQPYHFGEGFGESEAVFAARAADALEQRILKLGPERVAAFIGEPVQGAGGVIIPPAGYWERVGAICSKYDVLLICDEVICGFGRLGRWFGYQHFGLRPDIVTMAKGLSSGYLPISATVVSHPIVELLREKDSEFFHGFTYSGHPTCAAVALRNIEIIEREGLVTRVANEIGPYFNRALQRLRAHALVGEVRSLGLIGAVEIVRQAGTNLRFGDKEGTAGPLLRDRCIANGLMVRAVRDTIVICPPLVITTAEVDRLVAILDQSLREAATLLA
ncbi:MAG TPA: aminotransferase [Steroidobacteraceae bacterium]|nr:aminotransferase [Steroidobacteraceae bacterium]